jgi:dienelactone hydrolase
MAQRPRLRRGLVTALTLLAASAWPGGGAAQTPPAGVIVDEVRVADDPGESYALYLPSDYSPERPWSLLLAFHPQARGRALVETYRAAAERYGYVVAGSNTSRNGPWDVSAKAVRALSRDVGRRFTIDAGRVYLTGHSGGARVAMQVALGNRDIAGVIASSAGLPDAGTRKTLGFPVFATAGIDDFNYLELRRLDAALTSPHALEVFDGGHEPPPAAVAMRAIEWLELAATRDGRRAVDDALVETLFAAARRRADDATDPVDRLRATQALAADFVGLRDVSEVRRRLDAMERDPTVKDAVARDRAALDAEARGLDEALALESRLSGSGRTAALAQLDRRLADWARDAAAGEDTASRHRARRLLAGLGAGAAARVDDPDYAALLARHRWRRP